MTSTPSKSKIYFIVGRGHRRYENCYRLSAFSKFSEITITEATITTFAATSRDCHETVTRLSRDCHETVRELMAA